MAKTVRKREIGKQQRSKSALRKKSKKKNEETELPTLPSSFKPVTGRGAQVLKVTLPALPKGFAPKLGRGAAARRKK